MSALRLLFITREMSRYVERNTHYLAEELARQADLTQWNTPGDISEILAQLPQTPEFILLNDMKESRCPEISGLSGLQIPFGIIMHDLHHQVERRKAYIEANRVQHIFSIYRDSFHAWYPEYTGRMHWLPHWVDTGVFKDYALPKEVDLMMMGRRDWYYPLRARIYQAFKDRPGFVCHDHPGYRNIGDEEQNVFVGAAYAREINRAKIFLTGNSNLKYPLIKYYEVPACNTLLLAPTCNELEDLGFVPGEHFVAIDFTDFQERAEYYLAHPDERRSIAQSGYQMVRRYHSATVRASQLVGYIQEILGRP